MKERVCRSPHACTLLACLLACCSLVCRPPSRLLPFGRHSSVAARHSRVQQRSNIGLRPTTPKLQVWEIGRRNECFAMAPQVGEKPRYPTHASGGIAEVIDGMSCFWKVRRVNCPRAHRSRRLKRTTWMWTGSHNHMLLSHPWTSDESTCYASVGRVHSRMCPAR